jgi:Asp-tRNA(Asn)/Glu-tRNA(Gln) amidotransferase A subunit family amidase
VTIGYVESLSTIPASDANRRAVRMAKDLLEAKGFSLVKVDFTTEEIGEIRDIMTGLIGNYNGIVSLKRMDALYEQLLPQYGPQRQFLLGSALFRTVVKGLLKITGNGRLAEHSRSLRPMDSDELYSLMKLHNQAALKMKKKWEEAGVQALIMPNHPIPAFKAADSKSVGTLRDYQIMWSVLHYPAGTVPMTVMRDDEISYEDGFNDLWTKAIRKDIAGTAGMPVGVQVVAQRWDDEIVLGVMKALDEAVLSLPENPRPIAQLAKEPAA